MVSTFEKKLPISTEEKLVAINCLTDSPGSLTQFYYSSGILHLTKTWNLIKSQYSELQKKFQYILGD